MDEQTQTQTATVEAVKPPTPEPPTETQFEPASVSDDFVVASEEKAPEPASPVAADAPNIEQLQAQIAALEAAQAQTAQNAAEASARAEQLEQEAFTARREAARESIGLPAHIAALMPPGDPKDSKVAAAIEAFRADPKFAPVFTSRSQAHVETPDQLNARLGEQNSSPFSTVAGRRAKWDRMKGRSI